MVAASYSYLVFLLFIALVIGRPLSVFGSRRWVNGGGGGLLAKQRFHILEVDHLLGFLSRLLVFLHNQ